MKKVNFETITNTQSQYKIWPLNGCSQTGVKLNLLRKRRRVYESFSSRRTSRKSFILTILWDLEKLVKSYNGIIVLLHLIDPKQMVLMKERYAEEKKGHLLYCSNPSGFDEKWWADSMECYCNLRHVQDLLSDGKTPTNGDLENHLKARSFCLAPWLEITLCLPKVKAPQVW